MEIHLTEKEIVRAIGSLADDLCKYTCLQSVVSSPGSVASNARFRQKFNGFYRVAFRGKKWHKSYYDLFDKRRTSKSCFGDVLHELHCRTKRVEASFASKMVASIDPKQPVIDRWILHHVGMKLLRLGTPDAKQATARKIHADLAACYRGYLRTADGRALVAEFKKQYPSKEISKVKMLDFVIWKTEKSKNSPKRLNSFDTPCKHDRQTNLHSRA